MLVDDLVGFVLGLCPLKPSHRGNRRHETNNHIAPMHARTP
jgi:hypothetical protein